MADKFMRREIPYPMRFFEIETAQPSDSFGLTARAQVAVSRPFGVRPPVGEGGTRQRFAYLRVYFNWGAGASDEGAGLPSTVSGSISSTREPSGSKMLTWRLRFTPI